MTLYERVPLNNEPSFANGFGMFLVILVSMALAVWLSQRARESGGAEIMNQDHDIASSDMPDYINKIEGFQDDFQ